MGFCLKKNKKNEVKIKLNFLKSKWVFVEKRYKKILN